MKPIQERRKLDIGDHAPPNHYAILGLGQQVIESGEYRELDIRLRDAAYRHAKRRDEQVLLVLSIQDGTVENRIVYGPEGRVSEVTLYFCAHPDCRGLLTAHGDPAEPAAH